MNFKLEGRLHWSRHIITGMALLGAVLWSMAALAAGESIDRSFDVSASEQIEITIPRGTIQIIGTEINRFEVSGTLDEKLEKLVLESGEGVTQFEVILPEPYQHEQGKNKTESRLTFKVPFGALIRAKGTNTDFALEQLKGVTEATTINGDIRLSKLANQIKATTVNGDIKGSEIIAKMEMKSVNGDVRLTKAKGAFEVTSVNGDMTLELASKQVKVELVNGELELILKEAEQADLTNVNGDIEAEFPGVTAPQIQVSTVNGDATVKLPAQINAKFELAAKAGGDIDNSFNSQKPQSHEYGPGEWLNFANGEGKGQIKMSTVNGSLEIEKL